MGQEKGLVNLNGDPMLSYVVDSMLELVDEIVISVGKGRAGLYDEYREIGFEIVEDKDSGIGPLEGLICAFKAARGVSILVGPCDTPFLKKGVCQLVLSRADGRDGAVPIVRGLCEPLHGAFRREAALHAFEEALAGGKRKLTDAFAKLDLARVDEADLRKVDPELESFWNLNGPQELTLAEKRLAGQNEG